MLFKGTNSYCCVIILAIFFKELTEAKEMCDYFVQYIAGAQIVVS